MSTIKADAIEAATGTNTDLDLAGKGTGVPDIASGFKVGGTAGVPVNNLRVGTDGELITWDASGDPATVAVGTATHVLTSNGAGAAPTFQAAAGGGALTYISTVTASDGDSSIDFTSGIDSTYDQYQFHISGIQTNTDDRTLQMRYRTAGAFLSGSHYDSYTFQYWSYSSTFHSGNTENGDHLLIASQIGDESYCYCNGVVTLWNPASTAFRKQTSWSTVGHGQIGVRGTQGVGIYTDVVTAIDGMQFFLASSATLKAGTIRLYGVSNS